MPFSEFLGNARIVTTLRGMLANERVPSAMLFTGARAWANTRWRGCSRRPRIANGCRTISAAQCETCRKIAQLADPAPLIERGLAERGESPDSAAVERVAANFADASGCVGDCAGSSSRENSSGAAGDSHGTAPRDSTGCLFPAGGAAARVYFGWRGHDADGTCQCFSENSGGAAAIFNTDSCWRRVHINYCRRLFRDASSFSSRRCQREEIEAALKRRTDLTPAARTAGRAGFPKEAWVRRFPWTWIANSSCGARR